MNTFQKVQVALISLIFIVNVAFIFFIVNGSVSGFAFFNDVESIGAPYDFIQPEDFTVEDGKIIIEVPGYVLSKYDSSGSMLPVLSHTSNGVGIIPQSEEDVHVGDIVSFHSEVGFLAHRVVEKGEDEGGIYFITKGDNSDFKEGKIRFEDVESVLVAIIY